MKKTFVIPPEKGWEANTWYLVEVAYSESNPIHHSLYFSGFLNGKDGGPGGYNGFQPLNYAGGDDSGMAIHVARYVKVLKKVISVDETEKEFPLECVLIHDLKNICLTHNRPFEQIKDRGEHFEHEHADPFGCPTCYSIHQMEG